MPSGHPLYWRQPCRTGRIVAAPSLGAWLNASREQDVVDGEDGST